MARLIWVTRASSLCAMSRKWRGFCVLGVVLEEIEEVGDRVERIVNLVGDGGGEASGDGELLVGEQGGAGAALHGDVAEDHDDAGEFAGLVADGRSAVVDGDLRAILANKDGVVGDADDEVEALDLGDGVFNGQAGGLVDDVEDLSERGGRAPGTRAIR